MKETLKKSFDLCYGLGYKNGATEMKNEILKSINQDWKFAASIESTKTVMKILKKIDKVKVSLASLPK